VGREQGVAFYSTETETLYGSANQGSSWPSSRSPCVMLVWLEALEGPAKPSIQNISGLPQGPPRRYLLSVNSASMDGNGAEARSFL